MSDDFWDTLKVATQVLQPSLVALRYGDDMKGDTLALLYSLLLELDTTYSKPIKGLDEKIRTKLHNVFMSRWSTFHVPVHSAAFARYCTSNVVSHDCVSMCTKKDYGLHCHLLGAHIIHKHLILCFHLVVVYYE